MVRGAAELVTICCPSPPPHPHKKTTNNKQTNERTNKQPGLPGLVNDVNLDRHVNAAPPGGLPASEGR